MSKERTELALGPYRALDLTDEKGFLCGRILGDLGADVIKVEKPGGDTSRRIGPFYNDIPDPEKSLYWFAYNSNKRGITLNIETADGKEIFKKLVKTTDFIIESFPPGYMKALGLGYSTLSEINPHVIMTSISHFGQVGPYKDYKGSDIIDMAMSGYMSLCGDPDRPPVRISLPQAYLHAGSEAVVATMIAFHYRQISDKGQWIDVAVRDTIIRVMMLALHYWTNDHLIIGREGSKRDVGGYTPLQVTWNCKEGAVTWMIATGQRANDTRALLQWMEEDGMADDFLKKIDWENTNTREMSKDTVTKVEKRIARFFMTYTASELYEGAKKRRIQLYPVTTPKDIIENAQIAARGFWEKIEHRELNNSIIYPGAFIRSSEIPFNIRRPAPLIGEHNVEIYQQLGIPTEALLRLRQSNVV